MLDRCHHGVLLGHVGDTNRKKGGTTSRFKTILLSSAKIPLLARLNLGSASVCKSKAQRLLARLLKSPTTEVTDLIVELQPGNQKTSTFHLPLDDENEKSLTT